MSACHLLDTKPDADRETIRAEMSGNICQCTGYQGIVDAVERARGKMCAPAPRSSNAPAPLDGTFPGE